MSLGNPAKEGIMSKDINITDVIVHLHPDSSCDDRNKIERELRTHDGVISMHFNTEEHPHAMVVAYDSDVITSQEILAEIRKCDAKAVMAGM